IQSEDDELDLAVWNCAELEGVCRCALLYEIFVK
nr:hypothetical protein [Tanacetum cinerariifolium]